MPYRGCGTRATLIHNYLKNSCSQPASKFDHHVGIGLRKCQCTMRTGAEIGIVKDGKLIAYFICVWRILYSVSERDGVPLERVLLILSSVLFPLHKNSVCLQSFELRCRSPYQLAQIFFVLTLLIDDPYITRATPSNPFLFPTRKNQHNSNTKYVATNCTMQKPTKGHSTIHRLTSSA